jgi:hypothetical protein
MERGLDARPNGAFVTVVEGSGVALSASAVADESSCKAAVEGPANPEDFALSVDSGVPGDTISASPNKSKFAKSMMSEG